MYIVDLPSDSGSSLSEADPPVSVKRKLLRRGRHVGHLVSKAPNKSGAGTQFLLQDCMAKASRTCFLFQRHRHHHPSPKSPVTRSRCEGAVHAGFVPMVAGRCLSSCGLLKFADGIMNRNSPPQPQKHFVNWCFEYMSLNLTFL